MASGRHWGVPTENDTLTISSRCITLLSSLLPPGSVSYPKLGGEPDTKPTAPTILSSAADVVNFLGEGSDELTAVNSDDVEDESTSDALPPPQLEQIAYNDHHDDEEDGTVQEGFFHRRDQKDRGHLHI
ncbi:hypothetical protein Q1695_015590 [Nippostrongylus brasiliensis]|nr:hypothetical protein Q1695_015590 [Nippostrongylus brasiliensis]